jgi:hypothetical protein
MLSMTRIVTMAVVLAAMTAACGGGGSGGGNGPTGADRSKQISSVTDADKSAFCDWFAPMVGGYGTAPTCADWILSAPPDKADCMTHFPVCAVTVGELEDCVVAIVAAQSACTQQALANASARPDCQAVGAAGCFGTP